MKDLPMTVDEAAAMFFRYVWGDKFDWDDQHFQKTPARYVKMLRELTTPIPFDFTTFESRTDEMVTVGPIHFNSLCAHHVVPFIGECYVGYVPKTKIVGLSKIPRLVKSMAKTLTVQEELTQQIGYYLTAQLGPLGVAVVMRAEHLCMSIRGVQEHDTITTTSFMDGVFADHERLARSEFMDFVKMGGRR
jgi:GTP cyclohydrolase IA